MWFSIFVCSVLSVGGPWVAASINGEFEPGSVSDDLADAGWEQQYALTPSSMVRHYQQKNEATHSLQKFTTTTNAFQALSSINYFNKQFKRPTTRSNSADVTHHVAGLVGTTLFVVLVSTILQFFLQRGVASSTSRTWMYLGVLASDVVAFVFAVAALGTWAHAEVKAAACDMWTGKGAVTSNQTHSCGYGDGYNATIVLVVFSLLHLGVWAYGLRGDVLGAMSTSQAGLPSSPGAWTGASPVLPPSSAEGLKAPLAHDTQLHADGGYQTEF